MSHPTFDLDVLRTLVAGIELGSFAKAADRVGRSTAAVSAQLKKLEQQAGSPVLRKSGRGMALTPAGEVLLGYARRLLELNDEAQRVLRGAELQGEVRLGLQQDFGEGLLARVLAGFARAHPQVRVEAQLARNTELLGSWSATSSTSRSPGTAASACRTRAAWAGSRCAGSAHATSPPRHPHPPSRWHWRCWRPRA